MPELPEVETTKKGVAPFLERALIESIDVRNGRLRWPVPKEIEQINSVDVNRILRRGKYLIVELGSKDDGLGAILIHLGMSGSLRVVDAEAPVKTHDHVIFYLSSEKQIRFNDPRRFGCILWTKDWQKHALIGELGPEPLTNEFDAAYLYKLAKQRTVSIKQLIMNSRVVVGVGNIYANEALFLSGIHPKRAANRISQKRIALLVENIKKVLSNAIAMGGTTLKDFVGGDGKPGYFQQQLFVYGRAGESCRHCLSKLSEIRMNNRTTVFCSSCQC